MNKKCPECRLVSFADAEVCPRCGVGLAGRPSVEVPQKKKRPRILLRSFICFLVCIGAILMFYLSLLASAASLSIDEKSQVREAIAVLKASGFENETFLLENVTAFKGNDNWLNASVAKEDAYAATNFPFAIVTLYPDFFAYPSDATERAAILLHESKHLAGADEHEAYEFVWRNRKRLGWTRDKYGTSPVWRNIRRQTRDNVGELFTCHLHEFSDCTD